MTSTDPDRLTKEERPDDADLIEKARNGDSSAFDDLVRQNYPRVFGIAYHMLGHREDAEDLTQATFIKAYRALPKFRGQSAFSTWVHRIAVNETLNFIKRRGKVTHLSLAEMDPLDANDPAHDRLISSDSPVRAASLKDLQNKMNAALQSLSHAHRTVVVLHEIDGLPHEEIAESLGCSVGTVRSRLFYARQQLQRKLAEFAP